MSACFCAAVIAVRFLIGLRDGVRDGVPVLVGMVAVVALFCFLGAMALSLPILLS